MQEMQRMAPQINALKEKYKDDKQRQQQEIMKFYQENKINPLASCLPFLLQLPVFISLFYMLRTDLKLDICGPRWLHERHFHVLLTTAEQYLAKGLEETALQSGRSRLGQVPVHTRHHGQGDRRRADRADRRSTSARRSSRR